MNQEMSLVTAELSFLRDALRQPESNMSEAEQQAIYSALRLCQNKLLCMDFQQPTRLRDCGVSRSYH